MADSSPVVRRCMNCGQEYDLSLGLTECKACYQPLGYWCTRDSELSGSWLSGPECRQCVKREERNRKRREQRKKKREGSADTPAAGTLFEGLAEESKPASGSETGRRGRRKGKAAAAETPKTKEKGAPAASAASSPSTAPTAPTPTRPMLGSAPVSSEAPRIASVNSAGVVRRCTNCGTEYAPHADHPECAVCFNSLGWWCRTHSPAGGAWLSGAACPLCAVAPPSPRPAPRPRPPIISLPMRRPTPLPRPAGAGVLTEEPYLSPSLKALGLLYAVVFLMALVAADAVGTDAKMLGGLIATGVTAIALRFRITAALIVIAVFAACAGFAWLLSLDLIAAGLFALGSLGATRLRRARVLAVAACYTGALYGYAGEPVLGWFGIDRPTLASLTSRAKLPLPPAEGTSRPSDTSSEPPSAVRAANPDMAVLPTRIGSPRVLPGHNAPVYAVTYLPGGKSLLSLGQDGALRTWHLGTGAPLEAHGMPPQTAALLYDYSDDGDLLAEVRAQNPFSVLIWNSRNNALVRTFNLGKPVSAIAFSAPGVTVAAGASDGTVEVFDITTGRPIHRFLAPVGGPITALAFSKERNLLAAAGARGVAVWDFGRLGSDSAPVLMLNGVEATRVFAAAFTPGGRTLMTVNTEPSVSADLAVRYWDTASGTLLRTVQSEETLPAAACAIRPDGRQLACASRPDLPGDAKIYVYDLTGP